ncbi:MAG: bifunctional phosphoserine phosphatase/homoserine phosphotransferase ThrH [Desulfobacterales bacterium]|nr:bifunctional phosphoserine phosphatase/homoserine phosphotransferase ThrH [Desulfobacterales bacterium]
MNIICSDLEGVFIPEIWINVAEKTGIEELKLTTRDIPDYNVLMKKRLGILDAQGLKLKDITDVIDTMDPMEGAAEFVAWMRERSQLIILSDTFEQFAGPFMRKLGMPTLFCHQLEVDESGRVVDYCLRQENQKQKAVAALKGLNYHVTAFGDSYNDVTMLKEANKGFLFKPPANVIEEFPQFPVTTCYDELKPLIESALAEGTGL